MRKASRINKKACNNCGLEAAVARKVCAGCNTPFQSKRPNFFYEPKDNATHSGESSSTSELPQPPDENGRRRTERVKREKPKFYDSSQFLKKKAEKISRGPGRPKALPNQLKKKEKKRLRALKMREIIEKAEDENIYESIAATRKAEQLSVILEELNHKLVISAWKP